MLLDRIETFEKVNERMDRTLGTIEKEQDAIRERATLVIHDRARPVMSLGCFVLIDAVAFVRDVSTLNSPSLQTAILVELGRDIQVLEV